MTILPLTYLGNTAYFSRLLEGPCIIDLHENYVKQTFRNRCEILTAAGRAPLTVNVVKGGSRTKSPVRDIRIDYSKRWQHQHWMALVSSYANSPYFDHYRDLFNPFFCRRFDYLADLNIGLLETVMRILGNPTPLRFSESYIEAGEGDDDLRPIFDPSRSPGPEAFPPYEQVFSDRLPFQPNLSIIDLIFCEGRNSLSFL